MKTRAHVTLVVLCLLFDTYLSPAQPYTVDTLANAPNIALPTCVAFVPGSSVKFFFTEKNNGRIRIFESGGLNQTPFATVSVTSSGEQGLLGVAVHPQYPDSPFVYVYCTRSGDRANTVVRFRDSAGVGRDQTTLLVVPRLNGATNHNGGNIHFGPDGKLYVTIGENADQSNSQDSSAGNLRGKILRLNSDGSNPPDNPFLGKAFWSIGHRNSFDFTWDPKTGRMYCSENGPSCNDEVNRVPPRGNMGWPIEGNCPYTNNPLYVRPLYYFPNSPLPALTGITVYRANAFPRLRGRILFTGNSNPRVWTLTLTDSGDTIVPGSFTEFFGYSSGFSDIEVGPDGNLYVVNGPYNANKILRLRPVPPQFTSTAPTQATQGTLYSYTPTFGGTPPGLSITTGPDGMVVDSASWTVNWTPTNDQALQGHFTVRLRAENGAGYVDQVFNVNVANVNDPPGTFDLLSPPNDTTFSFTGSDPSVGFRWHQSIDLDRDTVRYVADIDTVNTFNSPLRRTEPAGSAVFLLVTFPRVSRVYYWRVRASDGQLTTISATWRSVRISYITALREPKEKEKEFVLEQNFPNPFNPSTSIKYTIPKSGQVRLSVFNLLGQEVALIFNGVQSAGTYEFTFNKSDLPTGIYFYRIQAPEYVETKKMIVTK